jgi:hypothetical protein
MRYDLERRLEAAEMRRCTSPRVAAIVRAIKIISREELAQRLANQTKGASSKGSTVGTCKEEPPQRTHRGHFIGSCADVRSTCLKSMRRAAVRLEVGFSSYAPESEAMVPNRLFGRVEAEADAGATEPAERSNTAGLLARGS